MEIKNLEDKHKDRLGFVLGAGPSLHHLNPDLIKDHITIAVNSAISKVKADYFISDDWDVANWDYYHNISPTTIRLLYGEKLKSKVNEENTILFKHKIWYDHIKKTYNPEGLILTKDANLPIIGARTSAGSAVHMAYIMGLNPIVLLGCDCCYSGGRRYFWQFPGEKKCKRLDGGSFFSVPNAGSVRGRPMDNHSVDFLKYWEALARQAKSQGIRIIDASNGVLECFEKNTLDGILNEYSYKNSTTE